MDQKKPKISIITVVFNCEDSIERTIKSVLSQSYPNIEYIIIDGKSSDGTMDVVNRYIDDISVIVSEPDKGIYNAMNKGIQLATGDLIGTINADDWLEEEIIETIAEEYRQSEFDIIHGNLTFVGKEHLYRKPRLGSWVPFWLGMPYFHPTYYVKREVYEKILYDDNYRVNADYKFTMECILKKYKFHYINQNIAYFSMDGASSALWVRIKEGHRIRRELGFNAFKTLLSSIFRIGVGLKGLISQRS